MSSPDKPKRTRKPKAPKKAVEPGPPQGLSEERKVGRPSSYQPEYAKQAEKLCILGATDVQLADFFGVSIPTLYAWAARNEEFLSALKTGKDAADERVERSLYHKAIGYTFESEKIFQHQGEIIRAQTREHVPPDTTAMIFWLKNRRKDLWRDKTEQDVNINVQVQTMSDAELDRLIAEELGAGQAAVH